MNQLEKEIEAKLRRMVEAHGGLCLKWVCPGRAGVPDRLILLPFGTILFAELKRPKGGTETKLQRWWGEKLRSLGFPAMVIRSEEEIRALEEQIRAWERAVMK